MASEEPRQVLDYAAPQERRRGKWRDLVALALALIGGVSAGLVLTRSGYGFCGAYIIFVLLCPVLPVLVAESHKLLCGATTGAALVAPAAYRLVEDPPGDVVLWLMLFALIGVAICVGAGIGAAASAGRRSRR